jgi:hypothetical protein
MRTAHEIRNELNTLSEERAQLWRSLALQHDGDKVARARHLGESIDRLWLELRTNVIEQQFGNRERLLERARADVRLERELNLRVADRRRALARGK